MTMFGGGADAQFHRLYTCYDWMYNIVHQTHNNDHYSVFLSLYIAACPYFKSPYGFIYSSDYFNQIICLQSILPKNTFHVCNMTDWAKLVDEKRASRDNKIPSEWRIPRELLKDVNEDSDHSAFEILNQHDLLSEDERRITEEYSARDLCAELASGRLSAVDVCSAFSHRAAVAQQLVSRVPIASD